MRGHVWSGWHIQGWAIDCRIMVRKQVRSRKDRGHMCGMGFQIIADVERSLAEASSSAAAGNRVTFSAQAGEIENINTGRKMPLVLRCGICIWRQWSGVRTLGFSRTVHVMDAFTSVFCALQGPKSRVASSSIVVDGTGSGAQEQEGTQRVMSQNPPMSAKRMRMRKKQRPAHPKPLRDPREPTAAERAPHDAMPFTIPFMCAECVAISATTRRAARFHKTRTPFWKSCRTGALSETETRSCSEKPFLSSHTGSCRQKRNGPDQNTADVAQRALNGLRSFGRCGRVHIKTDMGRLDVGAL